MNRKELHDLLSDYFSHRRDFIVKIFYPKVQDLLEEKLKNLHGHKIVVRLKDKETKELIEKYNTNERDFYNALLDAVIEKYQTPEKVKEEVQKWIKENISPLL